MSEMKKIFRKVSLDRLSSPEQLDMLMQVTSPRGWVALLALCGLLVVALFWGIFGSIPSNVNGTCILIRPGGVNEILASGAGRITDISVDVGDTVVAGQMVARIERREILDHIRATDAKLKELKAQQTRLQGLNAMNQEQFGAYLKNTEQNLQGRIRIGEERMGTLVEKIETQAKLLEQGLITRQAWLATKIEHANLRQEIDAYRNEIIQLGVRKLDSQKQIQNELSTIQIEINETERSIASQMRSAAEAALVYSPYNGRVLEIRIAEGALVNPGTTILAIEQTGDSATGLEAHIYVTPMDGKKIRSGMDVLITPSTVKREEYGVMVGKVKTVADFPSTLQGMMRVLNNDRLVQQLAQGGAPIAVLANLIPSGETVSGYKWSSPKGPNMRIESGTLCSASITVQKQRPISLVIPILREYSGI